MALLCIISYSDCHDKIELAVSVNTSSNAKSLSENGFISVLSTAMEPCTSLSFTIGAASIVLNLNCSLSPGMNLPFTEYLVAQSAEFIIWPEV